MPWDFSKYMKGYYHTHSVHPKFEMEIPIDGSKLPSKNPNMLVSENKNDLDFVNTDVSASFVACLSKNSRPSGREATKCSDAAKFLIDKVIKQVNTSLSTRYQQSPLLQSRELWRSLSWKPTIK
jgi:hypothetical protein